MKSYPLEPSALVDSSNVTLEIQGKILATLILVVPLRKLDKLIEIFS
jgi:hypothetical protein